jgi:heme oxygenase
MMNPIYNTFCAVLEEAHLLTHEAAAKLATHMQNNIHQSRYEDAVRMVQVVSKDVKQFVDEPWLAEIARLESRVKALEAKVVAKKK